MSIKIYNGAVFPVMSMAELLVFCQHLQKKLIVAKKEGMAEYWAEISTRLIDHESVKLKNPDTEKLKMKAWTNILDEIREHETRHERHPSSDYETSVVFFPMKDKFLAIFYGDNKNTLKIWEDNTKDYHFQDQSDQPKEITKKEFRIRGKDWETVLESDGKDGIPSHNGFTFQFTNNDMYFAPKWEEAKPFIPSLKNRVDELLLERAMSHVRGDNKDIPWSEAMQLLGEAKTFIANKDNKSIISKWRQLIESRLIQL